MICEFINFKKKKGTIFILVCCEKNLGGKDWVQPPMPQLRGFVSWNPGSHLQRQLPVSTLLGRCKSYGLKSSSCLWPAQPWLSRTYGEWTKRWLSLSVVFLSILSPLSPRLSLSLTHTCTLSLPLSLSSSLSDNYRGNKERRCLWDAPPSFLSVRVSAVCDLAPLDI